jgi:H+/Cl- antiporter ClcA
VTNLPGTGGHEPADGFKAGGGPTPAELPGVVIAAFATLACGAVLGPEAPLIALGAGLGALAVRLAKRDAPPRLAVVLAAAGSFAAVSTLFGSPILGAFLMLEASGLSGATLELVLVPGLLAAGVGSLVFVGLDSWTGFGTFGLAIPNIPSFGTPTFGELGWAVVIGLLAAVLGSAIKWLARTLQGHVVRRRVLLTLVMGAVVAIAAIVFDQVTDKGTSFVLFSGQSSLGPLIAQSAKLSVGTLLLLVACKGIAYAASLSAFRGGPVFPSMFVGAAGGMALSHLPGLPMIAGVAMGIGAMCAVMLRLPMTAVLLATLFLLADGIALMPLVVVAVVVAYVVSARFEPRPVATAGTATSDEAVPSAAGNGQPRPATVA